MTATPTDPIVYDVHFVSGREPQVYSLPALEAAAVQVVGHGAVQHGGRAEFSVPDDSASKAWSDDELQDALREVRLVGCREAPRCLKVLFLNGEYFRETVLGIQLGNAIVIFPDKIATLSWPGPLGIPVLAPERIERAVIVHELGHAFGLVGLDAPMTVPRMPPESDDPCQCHSSERESPMYFVVEKLNVPLRDRLEGTDRLGYRFTEADLADLRAFQASLGAGA